MLSGKTFGVEALPSDTVQRLKELLSASEACPFGPSEQRLIYDGHTLADEASTLEAAGLSDGQTVHLVRRLRGTSVESKGAEGAEAAAPRTGSVGGSVVQPPPADPNIMTVQVPQGVVPGQRLTINPPGRDRMMVTVPQNVAAGGTFKVRLPAQSSGLQRAAAPASGPQLMSVTCPPGVSAGQSLEIEVPGRGRMRVTVPSGVSSGQQFRFRVA